MCDMKIELRQEITALHALENQCSNVCDGKRYCDWCSVEIDPKQDALPSVHKADCPFRVISHAFTEGSTYRLLVKRFLYQAEKDEAVLKMDRQLMEVEKDAGQRDRRAGAGGGTVPGAEGRGDSRPESSGAGVQCRSEVDHTGR